MGTIRTAVASSSGSHQVTLVNDEAGLRQTITVSETDYILDAAEAEGIDLPYEETCRAGICSACAAGLVTGEVDQKDQSNLDDLQVQEGYVLLCVASPRADCFIETGKEEDVN